MFHNQEAVQTRVSTAFLFFDNRYFKSVLFHTFVCRKRVLYFSCSDGFKATDSNESLHIDKEKNFEMKIRRLQIRKYKIFDKIEFDFTDGSGATLDNIIIAGINGSGKTTLMSLLVKLFSDPNNQSAILPLAVYLNNYRYSHSFECEWLSLELDFNADERAAIAPRLQELTQNAMLDGQLSALIEQFSGNTPVLFQYERNAEQDTVLRNDFVLLHAISSYLKQKANIKVCFFPAETKLFSRNERRENERDSMQDSQKRIEASDSGMVRIIDLGEHKNYVEQYILQTINEQIYKHRDIPSGQIIKQETDRINALLEGLNFQTKLVDVTATAPVFENFGKVQIPINRLSSGEKQVFYRVVYLNSLNIQNSIIMVDEPELSLHPTWQTAINKLYTGLGNNNQVILATHSPQVISSTNPTNLFVLYTNAETFEVEVANMAKSGKYTKGVEPNRILKEIMGSPLRDYETQREIDEIAEQLTERYADPDFQERILNLTEQLGSQDPFVIRVNHQLLLLQRKKG